jgi:hypothetical protein
MGGRSGAPGTDVDGSTISEHEHGLTADVIERLKAERVGRRLVAELSARDSAREMRLSARATPSRAKELLPRPLSKEVTPSSGSGEADGAAAAAAAGPEPPPAAPRRADPMSWLWLSGGEHLL